MAKRAYPITFERLEVAVKESMFGLGSTGFCLNCGADREGCEPDARDYECYDCGAHKVYGAEEMLIVFA